MSKKKVNIEKNDRLAFNIKKLFEKILIFASIVSLVLFSVSIILALLISSDKNYMLNTAFWTFMVGFFALSLALLMLYGFLTEKSSWRFIMIPYNIYFYQIKFL